METELFIVTGTGKGLGRALVEVLARRAATAVVEVGRRFSGIDGTPGRPQTVLADFSRPDTWPAAFARLREVLGKRRFARTVLINNAGVVMPVNRFDCLGPDAGAALAAHYAVNVAAPIAFAGQFVALTQGKADRRMVLHISSGAAKRAVRGWTAYCSAKAALEMAATVMALEAEGVDPGLTVASLAPGVFDTDMQAVIREQPPQGFPDVARFRDMKTEGSLRPPIDVARDIVRHIDDNRFVNGGRYDLREL